MIIELHAIQTFAPSNLNRDDTGNPKEALFGGVRRGADIVAVGETGDARVGCFCQRSGCPNWHAH